MRLRSDDAHSVAIRDPRSTDFNVAERSGRVRFDGYWPNCPRSRRIRLTTAARPCTVPPMSNAAVDSRINAHPDAIAACGSYWFVFTYVSPASLVGREVLT